MADIGFVKDVVGQSVFANHDVNFWWENLHPSFVSMYIILLLIINVFASEDKVQCLPTNRENLAGELTDNEGNFLSEVCYKQRTYQETGYFVLGTVGAILIADVLCLVILPWTFGQQLSFFSEAKQLQMESNMSLSEFKTFVTEPYFPRTMNDTSRADNARKMAFLLKKCNEIHSAARRLLARQIIRIAVCTVSLSSMIVVFATKYEGGGMKGVLFGCNIPLNVSGVSEFMCTQTTYELEYAVIDIYMFLYLCHCVCHILGLRIIYNRHKLGTVKFFKSLQGNGRTSSELEFDKFIDYLFSRECSQLMEENIQLIGSDADSGFQELVETFTGSTRYGSDPNLQALIAEGRWDWIVDMLEEFPSPFDDLQLLATVDITKLDTGKGCSLLYYALNKDPTREIFQMRAARQILELTRGTERVVCYDGGRISASDFVKTQYSSDLTYPERIKDQLLSYM